MPRAAGGAAVGGDLFSGGRDSASDDDDDIFSKPAGPFSRSQLFGTEPDTVTQQVLSRTWRRHFH